MEIEQKQIRAVFDEKTIRVYRAFSSVIAGQVAELYIKRNNGGDITNLLPKEKIYEIIREE